MVLPQAEPLEWRDLYSPYSDNNDIHPFSIVVKSYSIEDRLYMDLSFRTTIRIRYVECDSSFNAWNFRRARHEKVDALKILLGEDDGDAYGVPHPGG